MLMAASMSFSTIRRIKIDDLKTSVRIGIHPHERKPQPISVDVMAEGEFPLHPESILDCFDYDPIHDLVVNKWPVQQHVDLLETLTTSLLEAIFLQDPRINFARVYIKKTHIFAAAKSVGVEEQWHRSDFERFKTQKD